MIVNNSINEWNAIERKPVWIGDMLLFNLLMIIINNLTLNWKLINWRSGFLATASDSPQLRSKLIQFPPATH